MPPSPPPAPLLPSSLPAFTRVTEAISGAHWDVLRQASSERLLILDETHPDGKQQLAGLWLALAIAPQEHQVALSEWLVENYPPALGEIDSAELAVQGCWSVLNRWYPSTSIAQRQQWALAVVDVAWNDGRQDWVDRCLAALSSSLPDPASASTLSQLLETVLMTSAQDEEIHTVLRAFDANPQTRAERAISILLERGRDDLAEPLAAGVDLGLLSAPSRYEIVVAAMRAGCPQWLDRLLTRPPLPKGNPVESQAGWVSEGLLNAPHALGWLNDRLEWDVLEREWSPDLVEDQVHDPVVDWIACASPIDLCERWAHRFPDRLPKTAQRLEAAARAASAQAQMPTRVRPHRRRS